MAFPVFMLFLLYLCKYSADVKHEKDIPFLYSYNITMDGSACKSTVFEVGCIYGCTDERNGVLL